MFGDTFTLMREGQAWIEGRYEGLYPLPFVMVMSILARLRVEVVIIGVLVASVILCVVLLKREALLWIMYLPILETLALGQLSIIWLFLMRVGTGLSFALMTLKPQLFFFAIPVLAARREMWRPFGMWCGALYFPALVVRPTWPVEWLQHIFDDSRITGGTSASLWPVPILAFVFASVLLLTRRYSWRSIFTSFNPVLRPYDYTIWAGSNRWLIPLSWVLGLTMAGVQAAWPMAFVGIAATLLDKHRIESWQRVRSPQAS